jgi:LAO/AO transport system kinase
MDALVRGLEAAQPRALGRAISLVERGGPAARELIARLYPKTGPKTGRARLVGLTGAPGSGKSTLVEALARRARRAGERVAVLAVDPTSPFTGGALLGDRVRMQSLYTDPGVFIRSMATRGALGGLAAAAHDAVDVLDAAGFDRVLVETVGVGQDEVDVVRSVDTVAVVVVPGMGDDIQANKAGLLEIADVFVLNKADREGVDRAEKDLRFMLELAGGWGAEDGTAPDAARGGADGVHGSWVPPVVRTVATRDEGIEELAGALEAHGRWLAEGGRLAERRRRRLELRIEQLLKARVLAAAGRADGIARQALAAQREHVDPYRAADRLFREVVERGAAPSGEGGAREEAQER